MNARKKIFLLFALSFLFVGSQTETSACDRSKMRLDSLVFDGTNYHIHTTVCFGGGVTGVNKGGLGDTRDIAFGFYTPGAVPINLSIFSPPTIVGDTTGCIQYGYILGPGGPPFNSQETLGYLDLSACPNSFMCITSTPQCGNVHTQIEQFEWVVDLVPDSVRLFATEGGGSAVAGCYLESDHLIDFTAFPVVWGGFEAAQKGFGNHLGWTTLNESNNSHFMVQRSGDGIIFDDIGRVSATGNSDQEVEYDFFDPNPLPGQNHYRINQTDYNGSSSLSKVVSVIFSPPLQLELISLTADALHQQLKIRLAAGREVPVSLDVFSVAGKRLLRHIHPAKIGENTVNLPLPSYSSGLYFVRIKAGSSVIERKVLVL